MTRLGTQVVLVAGGHGTRLRSVSQGLPKALAPVGGRPFLAYVLELLRRQGVGALHLCLGVGAEAVLRHLRQEPPEGMTVTVTVEDSPQGTAGALRVARPYLADEFIVLLGDTFTPVDLRRVVHDFRATGCPAAMTVMANDDWLVRSNVEVAHDRVVGYDKTAAAGTFRHVDYGIAVLRREVLDLVPADRPADLAVLFGALIARGRLAAVHVRRQERFYEIGSPGSHAEFERLVRTAGVPWPTAST